MGTSIGAAAGVISITGRAVRAIGSICFALLGALAGTILAAASFRLYRADALLDGLIIVLFVVVPAIGAAVGYSLRNWLAKGDK